MTRSMSMEQMAEKLRPLAKKLANLSIQDANQAKEQIEEQFSLQSPSIQAIRSLAEKGSREGWLLPKENGGIRFGRITKDLEGFSVDAVLMSSPGPKHRHGNGEIDLCFSTKGNAKFDGYSEGWVIYPPNSVHTPTVTDGEMLILYFLPGGAIEFL